MKKHVYDLRDLFCLIERTIDIEDQNVTWEGLSVYPFQMDKVPVNEAFSCSAVQEDFDRVEFAGVCSSDLHWQE